MVKINHSLNHLPQGFLAVMIDQIQCFLSCLFNYSLYVAYLHLGVVYNSFKTKYRHKD